MVGDEPMRTLSTEGDHRGVAPPGWSLGERLLAEGMLAAEKGRYLEALRLLVESLESLDSEGDVPLLVDALVRMVDAAAAVGHRPEAGRMLETFAVHLAGRAGARHLRRLLACADGG